MSDVLLRCDACLMWHGLCVAHQLGALCPVCGVGFLRLAEGEAGGTPSEGHAGLRSAGVPLEYASAISGATDQSLSPGEDADPEFREQVEGQSTDDELPIKNWVSGQRWSRKLKRHLRDWPGPIFHVPCYHCHLDSVIAKSSHEGIEAALDEGERWEVLCEVCTKLLAPDADEVGGTTEGQAEEISKVARIIELRGRQN